MGHNHDTFGNLTSTDYRDQTFTYTAGDCITYYGDFAATRNSRSQLRTTTPTPSTPTVPTMDYNDFDYLYDNFVSF